MPVVVKRRTLLVMKGSGRLTCNFYCGMRLLPRLTLSPSSVRSVQNESDDNIVKIPSVKNA